ncbi:caspase domain-containing protein [Melanogaster broomeanus]|nr:caspase domain-containing protein [Melanogaster broomeanus]
MFSPTLIYSATSLCQFVSPVFFLVDFLIRIAIAHLPTKGLLLENYTRPPSSPPKQLSKVHSPVEVPWSQPRLFALLIGINSYVSVKFKKLSGAVGDADAMKDYLEKSLNVPSNQILYLRDQLATRSAIIEAFDSLQNDSRVKRGDPILIFYAGHGGELPPSAGWEAGGVGSKIQYIVPHDYNETVGEEVYGIPDRTIAALIEGIAQKKGNNITVIFDCCHSGSSTRNDDRVLTRCADLAHNISLGNGQGRATNITPGFAQKGLRSHVLLAACSQDEPAREDVLLQRGRFTSALLSQNPQCEGFHQDRILFDAKVPAAGRVCYSVRFSEGTFIMEAGSAHGISKGAEFTVYGDKDLKTPPLGILTSVGEEEDLVLCVPMEDIYLPVFDALLQQLQGVGPDACKISIVGSEETAKLTITMENDRVVFKILDSRRHMPYSVNLTVDDIYPVLRAAAHYYWHLNRSKPNNLIQNKINVDFYQLKKSSGRALLQPVEPSLCRDNVIDFVVDPSVIYGVKITNGTPWDLYPNVFFFDNSDWSIQEYYRPPTSGRFELDVPLAKGGGTLTIGYGSSGSVPYSFFLPEGQDIDVGFLKIFLTTRPIDMSKIPQKSPFQVDRGSAPVVMERGDSWGTILIPVVQRRK